MKKLFLFLLCPIFSIAQVRQSEILWTKEQTIEKIKEKAKAENKFIFFDLYATWCSPCKKMDKEVYADSSVIDFLTKNFVSIKAQIDKTSNDDPYIKSWYSEVDKIRKEYKIFGVPSYIFFDPEGNILHREVGFRNKKDFLDMVKMIADSAKPKMYPLYNSYKNGKKIDDPVIWMNLAIFTFNFIDKEEAVKIGVDWKRNYLDRLPKDSAFTMQNLQNVTRFDFRLINPRDRYFKAAYSNPKKFDSIAKWGNRAFEMLYAIFERQLDEKLKMEGKWNSNPNWQRLQKTVEKKFGKISSKLPEWLMNYKVNYYRYKALDWRLWVQAKDERTSKYPPNLKKGNISVELNDGGAWDAFQNTNDTFVLKRALRWIDLALQYEPNTFAFLDTKANILYELGYNSEAIKLQQEAVELVLAWVNKRNQYKSIANEYLETLEKMKRGEPTWKNFNK